MPYTNEVRLMGVLADPPQLSCSESGEALCTLTVLVKDGDRLERIPVDVVGVYAEAIPTTADVGSTVLVEGRLVGNTSSGAMPGVRVVSTRAWDVVVIAPSEEQPADLLPEFPSQESD